MWVLYVEWRRENQLTNVFYPLGATGCISSMCCRNMLSDISKFCCELVTSLCTQKKKKSRRGGKREMETKKKVSISENWEILQKFLCLLVQIKSQKPNFCLITCDFNCLTGKVSLEELLTSRVITSNVLTADAFGQQFASV